MPRADFQNAKICYPSTAMGETGWLAVFADQPDLLRQILGDVYQVVLAEREREGGVHRRGRRPKRAPSSRDDLLRMVTPDHWNNLPFPIALRGLLAGRSQRQFAMKVPISQASMSRLLDGSQHPDLAMLTSIAAAAKVPAHFFIEYRALFISQLVCRVLMTNPHIGITAMKRWRDAMAIWP
jgi:hypothetical protein